MNMLNPAANAYRQPTAPTRSPRNIEYELLARMTQRLKLGWERRSENFPDLAKAVSDNARLWTTLAADVAGAGNGLPDHLRARLFYLWQFTDSHSRKILTGDGGVDVLVDINTAVMRGLRGQPGGVE